MQQAIPNSAKLVLPNWRERARLHSRSLLLGVRELLALTSLAAGLGLGFIALAEGVSKLAL